MKIFKDYMKKLNKKVTYFWNPGAGINKILEDVKVSRRKIVLLKREYYNL